MLSHAILQNFVIGLENGFCLPGSPAFISMLAYHLWDTVQWCLLEIMSKFQGFFSENSP